ncbi:MAG: tryptophan synthase subunit alpha [candidate division WOR-3 bacterium]
MSAIKERFKMLAEKNEAALIAYFTAGYPTLEKSMRYIQTIGKYADIIEIGIPFSDPIADGKVIQHASQIALEKGTNLFSIFGALAKIRIDKPLVIMSYLNPLLSFGIDRFFMESSKIGISGVIVPDLVVEETGLLKKYAHKYSIDLIQLIAPTSNKDRINLIGKISDGFVYCVSITGTTGMKKSLPDTLPLFIQRVKSMVDKPVVVGFGISRASQIKELCRFADGVVIGSRIIEAIKNREDMNALLKSFKRSTIR